MASHPCFSVVKMLDGKVVEVVKFGVTDEEADALVKKLSVSNPGDSYGVKLNVNNEGKDELW